ncbi:MAG: glycosyltransferase [Halolamina sp.]
MHSVAAFTDTYLPTVNGATYTVKTWRDRWRDRGGRMDVVYPDSPGHSPGDSEHPVRSVPFPFYDGFRFGVPSVPDAVGDVDLVHAHTPFSLGLAGYRLARGDRPLVANYHTPTGEYAAYITSLGLVEDAIEAVSARYERWFYSRADVVVAPSEAARRHLLEEVGVADRGPETSVEVVPNGVDTERFRPVDAADFRRRYDLGDETLVGYTGRHGHEKCLDDVLAACEGLDATVVFGGDGPARPELERAAAEYDVTARFLGFLDREELPAFYSSLSAFLFPSPVETQGIVALEANACGTPVVGVDAGALSNTVNDGETGHHFQPGDVEGFREAIERTLAARESLSEACLARRDAISVSHAVDRLEDVYDAVVS